MPSYSFDSYVTLKDEEFEVRVDYDYSPPEYGYPGMVEPTAVWYEDDGDIIETLPEIELAALEDKCWHDYQDRGERMQAMIEDAAEARREERLDRLQFRKENRI